MTKLLGPPGRAGLICFIGWVLDTSAMIAQRTIEIGDTLYLGRLGGERGAVSLTPRLQPGDNKLELARKPFLTVSSCQERQDKPLETVQESFRRT